MYQFKSNNRVNSVDNTQPHLREMINPLNVGVHISPVEEINQSDALRAQRIARICKFKADLQTLFFVPKSIAIPLLSYNYNKEAEIAFDLVTKAHGLKVYPIEKLNDDQILEACVRTIYDIHKYHSTVDDEFSGLWNQALSLEDASITTTSPFYIHKAFKKITSDQARGIMLSLSKDGRFPSGTFSYLREDFLHTAKDDLGVMKSNLMVGILIGFITNAAGGEILLSGAVGVGAAAVLFLNMWRETIVNRSRGYDMPHKLLKGTIGRYLAFALDNGIDGNFSILEGPDINDEEVVRKIVTDEANALNFDTSNVNFENVVKTLDKVRLVWAQKSFKKVLSQLRTNCGATRSDQFEGLDWAYRDIHDPLAVKSYPNLSKIFIEAVKALDGISTISNQLMIQLKAREALIAVGNDNKT